ncbi:MAG TPA: YbhB/YbcL family Raf kinase inhibitor-like protein [Candidatus Saccharimonadales bacterium]|nr:YbhB/YbcL family Raf kinase inhibitor-like protein [Candidatus Saccharimonadales bacterium]
MKITSPAFENNQFIPDKYTCKGENVNPPFEISFIPKNTKSLVLLAEDPDASIKTWTHWIVYNIDPQTSTITENSLPQNAKEAINDFGKLNYGGPCPPSGTHHYHFKLFALDTKIQETTNFDKATILKVMEDHVIEQNELIGLYSKK